MKKALFVLMILTVAAGGAFAQITLGANAGVEYTFTETQEMSGVTYNMLGFPAQVFGLYRIPTTIPIEGFGEATVDVGLTSGFINNIFGVEFDADSSLNTTLSCIPILGMARLQADWLYVDVAGGIYFPANDTEGDTIPFGGYSEVGYAYAMSEELSLTVGGRYTFVGTDANSLNMAAVVLGAAYQM